MEAVGCAWRVFVLAMSRAGAEEEPLGRSALSPHLQQSLYV